MAACLQLGLNVTGYSAIRSTDPEYPTLEPNMKCNQITCCKDRAISVYWGHMEPPFWGKGVVGVNDGTIRKSDDGFL